MKALTPTEAAALARLEVAEPELVARARAWARAETARQTARQRVTSAADAERARGDRVMVMIRRGAAALVAEQRARMARSAPPPMGPRCHVVPVIRS